MRCRVQRFLRVSRVVSFQSKGSISSTCNVYHTNIYICSNETTNSKGHTHLAALSGRKERLLEAGHCCARISVVGSSFFRLTRCERFPELCAWGVFNFREKIRFPIPPKDSSIRRRYGYYIYTKKWNNRRAEGDWRPRSQVSCWRHNPIRRLADFKVRPPGRGAVSRATAMCRCGTTPRGQDRFNQLMFEGKTIKRE